MTETPPAPEDCPRLGPVPALGLGTYRNADPRQCATSVETALELGYRHLDTAEMYDNEEAVGRGLARSSVDREEVFLATKVWQSNLVPEEVRKAARRSCNRLGVGTIDALYVHWPAEDYDPASTLPAFAELVDDGLVRHVGVSNFEEDLLEEAMAVLDGEVLVNQFELHPLLPRTELRKRCERLGVTVVGYAPLARGAALEHPVVRSIADAHDVTPAQISLAWARAKGVATIPKATGEAHIRENWGSLAVSLTEEDIDRIDGIEERTRVVDPPFGPWRDEPER